MAEHEDTAAKCFRFYETRKISLDSTEQSSQIMGKKHDRSFKLKNEFANDGANSCLKYSINRCEDYKMFFPTRKKISSGCVGNQLVDIDMKNIMCNKTRGFFKGIYKPYF